MYVLATQEDDKENWEEVLVFDQHVNLHHKFRLRERSHGWSVAVSDRHKVFVLVERDDGNQVEVYDADGRFVHSFGQTLLKWARDIAAAGDSRLMVFVRANKCVHLFSAQGDHLHQFTVQGDTMFRAIAFHQASKHVVVSLRNPDNDYRGQVSIYTEGGEFVRSIQLSEQTSLLDGGVIVTVDGCIAVACGDEGRVYVT